MGKKCTKCSEVKPEEEFPLFGKKKPGYRRAICKSCIRIANMRKYDAKIALRGGVRVRRTMEQVQEDIRVGSKVCGKCKERKPFAEFYPSRERRWSADGYNYICISCCSDVMSSWRKRNPELAKKRDKRNGLSYLYKMSMGDYHTLLEGQGSKCAICGTTDPGYRGTEYFAVDHCHSSGKIRGLLCHNCNKGLGHFKDSEDSMLKAIEYLKRFRDE